MIKENVIDVLMFLFDNFIYIEGMSGDERLLSFELEEAGFETPEITKAFTWLDELASLKKTISIYNHPRKALRVYSPEEALKLDASCQGFLLNLEQVGILDVLTREIIIERAMAFEEEQLSLEQFRRIAGLILLTQIHDEERFLWLIDFIYDDIEKPLH